MAANISKDREIERLIRQGRDAKSCLTEEFGGLRDRWDIPGRIRLSLKSHTSGWLAGAIGSGLATGFLARGGSKRKHVSQKPKGLFLGAIGLILTAIRPFAKTWLTGRVKNHLLSRANGFLGNVKSAATRSR